MRYRKLDANGDYSFGQGQANFYINRPEAVAQSVLTRMMLWTGQWFADLTQGTPWATQVLGERTQSTRDLVVQSRILTTTGVTDIADYASTINPDTRTFSAAAIIDTIYGRASVATAKLPATLPPLPPGPPGAVTAGLLGIMGGPAPQSGVLMEPANLTLPGQQDITDFTIMSVDGGRY